ncbi:unnamed protein product [Echinostoma caproni]|uniref:Transmembrane protein n=1 Tax=Echinostoma caproni TaxID=27848 RepID=A0A183A8U5_9TREM|nr:unnamed protein product [Echinostoma caproni]
MPKFVKSSDLRRNDTIYEYSISSEESGVTSSPFPDKEAASDREVKPVPLCLKSDSLRVNTDEQPIVPARLTKVRLNSVAEESIHTPPSDYHSSSLSTISSVTEFSHEHGEPFESASPEAHLSKLKSIHRKVKRRKQWRYLLRVIHFIVTKILVLVLLIASLILLLCGYFLVVHYLLVSGCIILLAAIGFQVQLCFAERTGPNKFNPMSVPFSIPAEDLTQMDPELVKERSQCGPEMQNQLETPLPRSSDASRNVVSFSDLQAKRLSLALARVANSALQVPRYTDGESTGVLRLARRLTMASSAIGIATHDPSLTGSSWLTGNQIRHGVRRSLAWNATGASRFYEQNYD